MKVLIFLTALALSSASDRENLRLAADNPQKLQALFTQFTKDNDKVYKNPSEARMRLTIFRNFVKEAAKVNDEQEDIEVGVTFFADLTEEEKMSYHGANITEEVGDVEEYVADEAPQWGSTVSHKARYGPIKHQGRCGSCWCYGAVGVTEGFQSMLTGRYTAMSEQQVLDCSGAGTCGGGYHLRALNYIRSRQHLAAESSYRYTGRKGSCRNAQNAMQIRVSNIWQARGDRNLASALAKGPVAVLLYNFHGVSVEGYKSGVMTAQNYGPPRNMPAAMNHIVVAVGYTSSNWELRNSWGTNWGNRGWFWHSRNKNNNRGISDYAYTMNAGRAGQEEIEE